MDYKDTLNLSHSDFPMRGNLPQNESSTYKKWSENKAFLKMQEKRKDSNPFNIHDGPPYANGHLHIGHALNKILKDIITKYYYFANREVFLTLGWDCHGLPIEQQIEQIILKNPKQITKKEFRELCRNHAKKFIEIQKEEFKSLGVLADFDNPYITMDFEFEGMIFDTLCAIAKKGILAQRFKPVYWSWACKSALAEAEVEYKNKESYSIFVAFALDVDALEILKTKEAKLVIWTTTPWTLPANVAIALKPDNIYVLTTSNLIVAKSLYEKLKDVLNLGEVKKEFNSNILENTNAINPLNKRKSRIILGEHVSLEDGSGAVHTAPGHGEEDYHLGLKYNLEVLVPVDDNGNFDESIIKQNLLAKEFLGVNIFEAQEGILNLLQDSLLHKETIIHSYPHCWRSHKPVIYRATTQWFILMDKPFFEGKTLRQIALESIENINFYPKSGYKRLKAMIENRPDWCISRQRAWGVPIAFFHSKDTNEAIFDDELFSHLSHLFKKEGLDCWWEKEVEDLLPPSYKNSNLIKGNHILDVWFDSGSTWNTVLNNPSFNAGPLPCNVYLEGSDQHRGWFQSSLLLSCIINQKSPFKDLITHGFIVDDENEKMSKSKGNVVEIDSILKEYGSEILRLWVALSDYQSDLKISKNILKQVSEHYKKMRNTIKFLLSNTNGFNSPVQKNELSKIDRWILKETINVIDDARKLFEKYEFSKAFSLVINFISNELSGIYFDICKDILYCEKKDSLLRLGVQTTLCLITKKLFLFLAPTLTYTIDEALQYAPPYIKDGENGWKDVFDCIDFDVDYDLDYEIDFSKLIELRNIFGINLDKLKKEKIIKNSLELEIFTQDSNIVDVLAHWLIVSNAKVGIKENALCSFEFDGKEIFISLSNLNKCPRCWKYNVKNENKLCSRCKNVVEELKA